MYIRLSRPQTRPSSAARLRRLVAILAAVIAGLLAQAAVIPAAFAKMLPDGGPPYAQDLPGAQVPAQIHAATAGGMPGWQITLIAVGAALVAAAAAVLLDRARSARHATTTA